MYSEIYKMHGVFKHSWEYSSFLCWAHSGEKFTRLVRNIVREHLDDPEWKIVCETIRDHLIEMHGNAFEFMEVVRSIYAEVDEILDEFASGHAEVTFGRWCNQ